jgi:hypothetical protein
MFILCHAAKNEPRKRARPFPPGPPLRPTRGSRVGVFVLARVGQRIFAAYSYIRSYCAPSSRADRIACFCDTSCYAARSVQEARPGVPPGDPLACRRGVAASGFLCRQGSGKGFFAAYSYIRSYCATLSRADRVACFCDTSCYAARSVQEARPDVPSGTSLGSRRGAAASGCLYGQALGKDFCHSVSLEICANKGA